MTRYCKAFALNASAALAAALFLSVPAAGAASFPGGGSSGSGGSQPPAPTVRYGFEDGTTDGWAVRWGTTLKASNETGIAFNGTHGLALDVSGPGYPAAGVPTGVTAPALSSTVVFHVWAPSGVSVGVSPVLMGLKWYVVWLANHPLVPGWNTITFTVPISVFRVDMLGLQVNDATGWAGRLVLDSVTF